MPSVDTIMTLIGAQDKKWEIGHCDAMKALIFIIHHFVEHQGSVDLHHSYFIIHHFVYRLV
jgi:hypothetical protein